MNFVPLKYIHQVEFKNLNQRTQKSDVVRLALLGNQGTTDNILEQIFIDQFIDGIRYLQIKHSELLCKISLNRKCSNSKEFQKISDVISVKSSLEFWNSNRAAANIRGTDDYHYWQHQENTPYSRS